MTKIKFIVFWLFLALATIVFNSCSKDDDSKQEVTSISLDKQTLTLSIGEDYSLTLTVSDNAIDKTVTWTSSSDAIATISADGKVNATATGTATITAKVGNLTAACVVTVIDGVVINGIKWATRNVDKPGTFAAKPEDPGMFYQWNSKKAWAVTGDATDWDDALPEGDTWERLNDPSPEGWRIPTLDELKKLSDPDKVSIEWTTRNGINGRKSTDKATGHTLFMPAVGSLNYFGRLSFADMDGYYWCSWESDAYSAYGLDFNVNNNTVWLNYSRILGLSVRAVAE